MKKIYLLHGKVTLVDDEDYEMLIKYTWHCDRDYVVRNLPGGGTQGMQRMIMNTPKGKFTDHINGNPLDNRKRNLRICTRKENNRNARSRRWASGNYKGVTWNGDNKKWAARIRVNDNLIFLGYYACKKKAARKYNRAAKKYFGEFARLNMVKNDRRS